MKRYRKTTVVLLAAVLCCLCYLGQAAENGGALTKINYRSEGGKLVIEFKGTQRLKYRVKEFENPPHILVQFYGAKNGLPYSDMKIDKGGVTGLSVQEIDVNGEKMTSVSIHLTGKADYDFDLSSNGQLFALTTSVGGEYTGLPASQNQPGYTSATQQKTDESPVIHVPGEKKPTKQIPYVKEGSSGQSKEVTLGQRAKGADTSPYIVGPVILQDADISQAVRLLSEAAGGANIVVEASIVQAQSTTGGSSSSSKSGGKSGGTGATAAGITVTLSHITLEDALDIITASNNWSWRKFGSYYAIISRDTANQGVDTAKSATVFEDTATRTDVVIVQPKNTYACDDVIMLSTVIPEVECYPETNYLLMRGVQKDLDRAREMLKTIDVPIQQITKMASQVTKIIRLKYIQVNNTFQNELGSLLANPYFGGLVMGVENSKRAFVNTISLDNSSNSIIYVGDDKIYERFYNLIQALDVPERETVVKTIPLKYILARDLNNVEPISDLLTSTVTTEKVIISEPTNSLTYVGNMSGYERITEIIRTLDIPDRQYVTKVVPFKYLHTLDLQNSETFKNLQTLPGFGNDSSSKNITTYTIDQQTNSVIISTQKQYLDQVVDLVKSMDTNIFDQYELETFSFKYTSCLRAIQIIGNMMITQESDTTEFPDGNFFARLSGENDKGVEFPSNEIYTSSSTSYPQSYKWAILPDASKNAVIALARHQEMSLIKKIVNELDKPYPQLKLDVQVVELSNSDTQSFKLSYLTSDGKFVQGGNVSQSITDFTASPVDDEGENMECNNYLTGCPDIAKDGLFLIYDTLTSNVASFGASLQAVVQRVNGRVVANPTMITPEYTGVSFDFTDKYIYTKQASSGLSSTIETGEVAEGYAVSAIPHFKDDYIVLSLTINASQIKSWENGYPVVGDRKIISEIKCKNGEPIIIGGMVKSSESLDRISLPIVSKLPIVGSLFRQKSRKQNQYETIMVITPTILEVK